MALRQQRLLDNRLWELIQHIDRGRSGRRAGAAAEAIRPRPGSAWAECVQVHLPTRRTTSTPDRAPDILAGNAETPAKGWEENDDADEEDHQRGARGPRRRGADVPGRRDGAGRPGSDLDLTKCSVVDDPVDYGDGIDWHKIEYTILNEGSAPTGSFVSRAKPVYGKDEISSLIKDEAFVTFTSESLTPGQSRSGFFRVTEKVVGQTWGIHLDVDRTTGESRTDDSFCSKFVNRT